MKFDNDCDAILLFNTFILNPISKAGGGGGGGVPPRVLLFACNVLFFCQFPPNLVPFLRLDLFSMD